MVARTMHRDTADTADTAPAAASSPVQAIVRIRLATTADPDAFEGWLRRREVVSGAWALSGDHDYEVRLACPDLRELTAELRRIRQHGGAEETTTCLLLRDVFEV
jgi:DNA-binding Lrp family transcriptional regulator